MTRCLVEQMGKPVFLLEGERTNIKITRSRGSFAGRGATPRRPNLLVGLSVASSRSCFRSDNPANRD